MSSATAPRRVITATAPVRICDVGGWTDTWFAGHGAVFSIAVSPLVEVRVEVAPRGAEPRVLLSAPDLGERYRFDPGTPPGRQPLLEAGLVAAGVPGDVGLEVEVRAGAPPGCGTGTSAAVLVALLGALDRLTPGRATPLEIARAAHEVETGPLGLQSGVQDQLASAVGGVNLLEVRPYPTAMVHPVAVPPDALAELERRLVLVFLGRPHHSSAIHEQVIARLAAREGDAPELAVLREAASWAADAAEAGDLEGLGDAMVASTEAHRRLHPALVSRQAEAVLAAARLAGASGWKVNGAGGDGGSLTLLAGGGPGAVADLVGAVTATPGRHRIVPIRLAAAGLQVRDPGGQP